MHFPRHGRRAADLPRRCHLCERLAAGPGFVVRYDLRDTGRSTMLDPDAPRYTLRDLVADAAGVLDALGLPQAHVGFGAGGWIAQLMGLDHRDRVASLTLVATRPTAPGPNDPDLPEHAPRLMSHLMSTPEPDWSDRAAVLDYLVETGCHFAGSDRFDEVEVRENVGRLPACSPPWTPATAGASASARSPPRRWSSTETRTRSSIGNAEALANEIPGAELLTLPKTGQELPRRVWDVFVAAVLRHTSAN